MKTGNFIAGLFCASVVLAAPFTELRRQRRQAASRRTLPPQNVTAAANVNGPPNVNVQYDSNWAGAVLIGNGFTSVTGTITVPVPKAPSGGSRGTEYAASAWVGIDGDTCQSAILQTGVDFYIQNGRASYDAWYEWYPDYAYTFDGFSVSAGDSIEMTVTAYSTTSGIATIINQSTGQTVSHTFTNEASTGTLCETNAEWIIEDFSNSNGNLVPFANFGTVTFTGASAVEGGSTVDTTGATIIDIRQNNQVLTDCSAGGSQVTCTYE